MESDITQSAALYDFLAWCDGHKKQILVGAIVVILVGTGVGFFFWHQNARETAANEALSQVVFTPPEAGRSRVSPDALLKVANEYAGTDAAGRALLLAGADLFGDGKYTEAQTQFQKFLHDYHDPRLIGQAQLGVASCLDAGGKTDDAIKAYKDLVDHHANDSIGLQAQYALGRLYESQGKLQLAHDNLEQAARKDPYGSIGSEAGMRASELVREHPELAPAPVPTPSVAPTNSVTLPLKAPQAAGSNPVPPAVGTNGSVTSSNLEPASTNR